MFGGVDLYISGKFEEPVIQAVFDPIRATDSSHLFDFGRLRRNDCAVALAVDEFARPDDRVGVELNFDVFIELKIVRCLIVGGSLAADGPGRLVLGRAVNSHIDIFEDAFVVFETQIGLRVNREQSPAAFGAGKRESFGVYRDILRQLYATASRPGFFCATRQVIPGGNHDERGHNNWKDDPQNSNQMMCENPFEIRQIFGPSLGQASIQYGPVPPNCIPEKENHVCT